jgi:ring-1,2-phenylacetyl-CoA epoxidase subunit PaaC
LEHKPAYPMQHILTYTLRLADSSLILGHRLSEWAGHGPVLEEDIAMSNIALDLVGQARLFYQYAARLESSATGQAKTEDDYAYWRGVREYRNYTLCELPNSGIEKGRTQSADYAFTVVRNLLWSAFQIQLLDALGTCADADLAAIAAKSVKESRYHFRHAADWVVRMGDGTDESHARAQRALDALMPYTAELFADDEIELALASKTRVPQSSILHDDWKRSIQDVLEEATLKAPDLGGFQSEGKWGLHSEHLDFLLAEMQSLARQHPGATW